MKVHNNTNFMKALYRFLFVAMIFLAANVSCFATATTAEKTDTMDILVFQPDISIEIAQVISYEIDSPNISIVSIITSDIDTTVLMSFEKSRIDNFNYIRIAKTRCINQLRKPPVKRIKVFSLKCDEPCYRQNLKDLI